MFALRQEIDELRRQLNDKQRRGTSSGPLSGEVSVDFNLKSATIFVLKMLSVFYVSCICLVTSS